MSVFVSDVVGMAAEQTVYQGMMPMVRIARTLPELEKLRELWELWCNDPNADLDFYLECARTRPEFVRPHVMILYRGDRPDCMLVGRLEHCRLKLKVGYRTFAQPRARQLFFVRGGYFGNPSEENIRRLIQELRRCLENGEADLAELPRGMPNATLDISVTEEFHLLSRGHFSPINEHRWLELPSSYEEFLKDLPRKSRHELRRHEKKLAEEFSGRAHVHCFHEPFEVEGLAHAAEEVAAKTYQRVLGVGFQPNEEILQSLRIAAEKRGLRGCVLYLDEKPTAFFIGKHYKTTLHGHFMGFDPQFGKYSPGLLILMHSIADCFKEGQLTTQVDLGWGDRQYKRMLCNRSRHDGALYVYASTWTGLRLNVLRSFISFFDYTAKEWVAKSPWLQRVKKAWQGRQQLKAQILPEREQAD